MRLGGFLVLVEVASIAALLASGAQACERGSPDCPATREDTPRARPAEPRTIWPEMIDDFPKYDPTKVDVTDQPRGRRSAHAPVLAWEVQRCWNVGALSPDALKVTVKVLVTMNADGTPGEVSMSGFRGGDETAARQAYEAARRAILICGAKGYPLPTEKYGQWREIEMTFDPAKMRIR